MGMLWDRFQRAVRYTLKTWLVMLLFVIAWKLCFPPPLPKVQAPNPDLTWSTLNSAIEDSHEQTVRALVRETPEALTWQRPGVGTPLHVAATYNRRSMAELLLQLGSVVDATDNHGETPLHRAAVNNSREVALCLLQHGADINRLTQPDAAELQLPPELRRVPRSPLDMAANRGAWSVAKLLLEEGAHLQVNEVCSALHYACTGAYTDQFMSRHDVLPDGTLHTTQGMYVSVGNELMIDLLVDYGANPLERDAYGSHCLDLAIGREAVDTMEVLLRKYGQHFDLNGDASVKYPSDPLKRVLEWRAHALQSQSVRDSKVCRAIWLLRKSGATPSWKLREQARLSGESQEVMDLLAEKWDESIPLTVERTR